MSIPREILAVKRPKSTIVKATKKAGIYSVIKRTSKHVPGKKNPRPVELGVVGKIINGVYVPNPEKDKHEVDFKIYGPVALCNKVGAKIFDDLLRFYQLDDARKIYAMAILRCIDNDLTNEDIKVEYETSYLSEMMPGVALSANTISSFLERIGKKLTTITSFMNDRIRQYSGNPTVIDGMLKNNSSTTNTFSEFSRKGRVKGREDVSLMYAYNLNIQEPVACMAYPGNMLDFTAFSDFINTHPINNGFTILDKGFDDAKCKQAIAKLNSKYIIPLKLSSTLIAKYQLDCKYEHNFKFDEDCIRCKKVKTAENIYYYAFKSSKMKAIQDKGYVERAFRKGSFVDEAYSKKESKFGLIVFESNADLEPEQVYTAYKQRWEIETLFNNYKNIIERDMVNVHGNYRLFATEFINFISAIISMKIKKLLNQTGINKKFTQKQVFRLLSKYAKKRNVRNPETWCDCSLLKYITELCVILEI